MGEEREAIAKIYALDNRAIFKKCKNANLVRTHLGVGFYFYWSHSGLLLSKKAGKLNKK
jgi:hypothetical protein